VIFDPISRSRHFWKSNIVKTAGLKDKVTIAQQETIANIWNGKMFGDLDLPLNASHGLSAIAELLVSFVCFCKSLLKNSASNTPLVT